MLIDHGEFGSDLDGVFVQRAQHAPVQAVCSNNECRHDKGPLPILRGRRVSSSPRFKPPPPPQEYAHVQKSLRSIQGGGAHELSEPRLRDRMVTAEAAFLIGDCWFCEKSDL